LDRAFLENALNRWQRTFPEAQTIRRLDSVGHFVQEEAPDELGEAVVHLLERTTTE
jgi:hypothetical protein